MSTKIEWTDETWNPLHGCSDASAGCTNCYAKKEAHIHANHPNPKVAARFEGLTRISGGKVCWTGKINLHEDILLQPLKWKRPRRVFVNSQSDLFHPSVPFEFVDKVFAIMALTPQHTYQVLTKRPERMAEYFSYEWTESEAAYLSQEACREWLNGLGYSDLDEVIGTCPKNAWGGVSVEDQKAADERIQHLLECPFAVRFLSCEPLIGAVNLAYTCFNGADSFGSMPGIHWVICGGESGHGARPMRPDWARSLRDQCVAAGVPFFFKQWGEWVSEHHIAADPSKQRTDDRFVTIFEDEYGKDYEGEYMCRVGRKVAGRLLDDRAWDEYPEVAR